MERRAYARAMKRRALSPWNAAHSVHGLSAPVKGMQGTQSMERSALRPWSVSSLPRQSTLRV
eukprot:3650121-Rhodomonas_salina.1